MKGSISTSKPFDIFFSGSCCWSLGRLEDVEVVSSLEVAETLVEDSFPSFAIFDPCGSCSFSLKWVVLTTFVWLFCFLALCVLLNLFQLLIEASTCIEAIIVCRAKYGNSWHLGAFCALENGYCFSPESRPSRPHVGFRLNHMSIGLICREKRWLKSTIQDCESFSMKRGKLQWDVTAV